MGARLDLGTETSCRTIRQPGTFGDSPEPSDLARHRGRPEWPYAIVVAADLGAPFCVCVCYNGRSALDPALAS